MRSVVTALKGHIKNVHLVLYDYAFNATTDIDLVPDATKKHLERKYGHGPKMDSGLSQGAERHLAEKWRVAQTPKWLDFSAIDKSARGEEDPENPYPNFRYAAHSEIFYLPTTEEDPTEEAYAERQLNLQQWREKALPTYNSMAIESRIGWIPGLEDVSVALNDDFFILREHAVSDFHSPLFGSVIRFDNMVSLKRR
jgi:3-O-alpha-D-mannopyranosyl-alpha-D-mannopyranose xylosylphosphotransferase